MPRRPCGAGSNDPAACLRDRSNAVADAMSLCHSCNVRESRMPSRRARLTVGLTGTALMLAGLLIGKAISGLVILLGAALLLAAIPYGSTSVRKRNRAR